MKTNNRLSIGMMRLSPIPNAKAKIYALAAQRENCELFYFCPENVDLISKKINAKHYINNKWVEKNIDYPSVIDNGHKTFHFSEILNDFDGKCILTYTNKTKKINLMNFISGDFKLSSMLVPSLYNFSFKEFILFIEKYKNIVVKPVDDNNKEYHVVKAASLFNVFELNGNNQKNSIYNIKELEDFYYLMISGKDYFLKEKLCSEFNSPPFYLRIYFHRVDNGWTEVKRYIKISTLDENSIYQNYNALIFPVRRYLESLIFLDYNIVEKKISRILSVFTKSIDDSFGYDIGSFGLDVGFNGSNNAYILRAIKYPESSFFENELADIKIDYLINLSKTNNRISESIKNCKNFEDFFDYASRKNLNTYRFYINKIKPYKKGVFVLRELGGKFGVTLKMLINNSNKADYIIAPKSRNINKYFVGIPIIYVDSVEETFFSYAKKIQEKYSGHIFSVTGSAGKTSTSKLLNDALISTGESTYINLRGNTPYNIASGLLNIELDKRNSIFEVAGARLIKDIPIGQFSNKLIKPDICIFTTIAPAHIEVIGTFEDLVKRKAAMFYDLPIGSKAIINRDIDMYDLFYSLMPKHIQVYTYGVNDDSNFKIVGYNPNLMTLNLLGQIINVKVNNQPLELQKNFLAVIAALILSGKKWTNALNIFNSWVPPKGRGDINVLNINGVLINVIDDSYNANPSSMKLSILKLSTTLHFARKIIVLSEMSELGENNLAYHQELIQPLIMSSIDKIILIGEKYKTIWAELPSKKRYFYFDNVEIFKEEFIKLIDNQDLILFKGSNGTGLNKVIGEFIRDFKTI